MLLDLAGEKCHLIPSDVSVEMLERSEEKVGLANPESVREESVCIANMLVRFSLPCVDVSEDGIDLLMPTESAFVDVAGAED